MNEMKLEIEIEPICISEDGLEGPCNTVMEREDQNTWFCNECGSRVFISPEVKQKVI